MSEELDPKYSHDQRRCIVCGERTSIRYAGGMGQGDWYCPRHVPPPAGLTSEQRKEWQATTAIFWFFRDHKRMPSLDDPSERALLLNAIPFDPATPAFRKKFAGLEKASKRVAEAPRRYAAFSAAWNFGCLSVILLLAIIVVAWSVVGIVWLVKHL